MNSIHLRSPYEIPLYVLSVLVNLLIIALILVGIAAWISERAGGRASIWPRGGRDPSSLPCAVAPRAWPGLVSSDHPRGHTRIGGETLAPPIPRHLRRER